MNRKQELKENMQRLITLTESCSELSSQLSELRKEKKRHRRTNTGNFERHEYARFYTQIE